MRCPYCGCLDTQVKDSRPAEDNAIIRRRRTCPVCGGRFTTFERVQLRDLMVIKRSGRRVAFDRTKIEGSVALAVRKRPIVGEEAIERMISGVVRQLESCGESEVSSVQIGALVMAGLKALDSVAYVRFASVYCDFNEVDDFYRLIAQLASSDGLEMSDLSVVDETCESV